MFGSKQANEDSNKAKALNGKTRPTKSPPKSKTQVGPKLSQIAQAEEKDSDVNKTTGDKKGNTKDPYLFTDTESTRSLELKSAQEKSKQREGRKRNRKQESGKMSDEENVPVAKGKRRGSQMSTQAFSPELSQESLYSSQNDFRSPVPPSSGIKAKQGKGRSKKTAGKKSKAAGRRGKAKTPSDVRQEDDSLSDVEIMRDASAPMSSSIQDKFDSGSPIDDDAYHGDEIYKLSGDIASKLNQKKAELEKFLNTNRDKEQVSELKENNRNKRPSAHSNMSNTGKEEIESKGSTGDKKFDNQTKQLKNTNAFNNFTKPKFDPALLKFPTRVGPIPTPDALEEESKKMQKKKTISKQPSSKPFSWDESEEEECSTPTKQISKKDSSSHAQRKDQHTARQIFVEVAYNSDIEANEEDIDRDNAKTRKQRGGINREDEMDLPESTNMQRDISKGRQKQQKQKKTTKTDDEDSQDSITEQEEKVANSRKQKKSAQKSSRKDCRKEASKNTDVQPECQSDEEIGSDRKKTKCATKQKKQLGKKKVSEDSTEEGYDEVQDRSHRSLERQSIKSQKEKSGNKGKQEKQLQRKTEDNYSSEEFDIEDVQDSLEINDEIQARPTKDRPKKQKKKPTEKQIMVSAKASKRAKVSLTNDRQKINHTSRKFSSQIEEAESDDMVEKESADGDKDKEDDRMTVTSVESFHSLCKVRMH